MDSAFRKITLPEEQIFRGFHLLDLARLDFDALINSDKSYEVIIALLSDYETHFGYSDESALKTAIRRLKTLTKGKDLLECIGQLEAVSIFRGYDASLTKLITDMYKFDLDADVRQHYLYKQGREHGEEETITAAVAELYKNGVSSEIIAKSFNISLERVESILKE